MKSFKEILDEARMIASAGYRISPSGRKVRRLIRVGDDDYHKADDIDKDGDVDADDKKAMKMRGESVEQIDEISDKTLGNYIDAARKDREHNKINKSAPDSAQRAHANERDKKRIAGMNKAKSYLTPGTAGHAKNQRRRAMHEDAEQIEEAVSVKKQDYSWGKMITVHHGADTSYPLHPEHQSAIKKLKDGEHTSFTDETNRKVTAHREGEHVHLTSKGTSRKTTVAHSHFNESVNKSDIPAYLRKKTGDKLTTQDLDKERTQNRSHPETIKKINGTVQEGLGSAISSVFQKMKSKLKPSTQPTSAPVAPRPMGMSAPMGMGMGFGMAQQPQFDLHPDDPPTRNTRND